MKLARLAFYGMTVLGTAAAFAIPAAAQSQTGAEDEVILQLPEQEAPLPDTSPEIDGVVENELCYEQFYEGGTPDKAVYHCSRAIESGDLTEADLVTALINRGVAYKKLGKLDEAIADYSAALERAPEDGLVYANRANAYLAKYQLDAAITDASKAIAFMPEYAAAYYVRASAYEVLGQKEFARTDFLRAVELAPDNEAYKEKAWSYGANQ